MSPARFGLVAFAVVALLVACAPAADAPPAAPPLPPELKLLDRLVGRWESTTTVTTLDGKAVDLRSTGTLTREWALGGRFVEERGKSSTGEETRVLFGYDAAKQAYRMCYFSSAGVSTEGTGGWCEPDLSLRFGHDLGNGLTQKGEIRFVSADVHEWTSTVRDAAGKVLFAGSGRVTRAK